MQAYVIHEWLPIYVQWPTLRSYGNIYVGNRVERKHLKFDYIIICNRNCIIMYIYIYIYIYNNINTIIIHNNLY